jgi:hypothetical protein
MAFNLYFAGVQCEEADQLLMHLNCNRLFSQENDRAGIAKWCRYKNSRRCNYQGKLFIDSGAFSVHTKQIELDVDEYISYINSIDDKINLFAQVDKIPGEFGKPKTLDQIEEASVLSWENYLYMKDKVISRDKLLPIFHQGERFEWLRAMLCYKHSDGLPIKYIGISPANDKHTSEKEEWIQKCFYIIKRSPNPAVKTHAFGMTSLRVLERYPFTSADSTTWLMVGANGNIMTPYGVVLVSDRALTNPNHIMNKGCASVTAIRNYVSKLGYSLEDCMTNYKVRMCVNIRFLKNWADNYKYTPISTIKKNLF